MEIKLKTLTPLWTGGVETGRVDRLHETGILGSMRWWMEALVRGMGGEACDFSQGTCRFDSERYCPSSTSDERQQRQHLRDAGLCDVCQLFGATGWRRRFRIEVLDDQTRPIWGGNAPLNIRPPDRTRGWFLPPGRMGDFVLKIQGDQASLAQLAALLLFMERWGNLGAKAQVGYGAFALQDRETVAQFASRSSIGPVADAQEERVSLPNLQHFGFFRYRFRPPQPGWWTRLPGFERIVRQVQPLVETYQTVPLAPVLKNVWRFQYWQREWGDAGTFWGMLGRERIRGKVLVSWAYPRDDMWELHGSAWLHGVTVQPVWAMLSNGNNWNQVLGVQGSLETFPVGAWRPWTATTVHDFMKQAAHP